MKKISVVIPVFNVEEFLPDCLNSVINQTYKNLEIILINDGSKDNSLSIMKEFQRKDNRVILFDEDNLGPSAARNKGIEAATGDYIIFIDSDDWIDLDFVEKLYNAIDKTNADIAAASIIRKRKNSQKYRMHYIEEKVFSTLEDKLNTCKVPNCCYVVAKLYRTPLVKQILFTKGVYFEDVLWLPKLLKATKNLVTVPETNYYYRVNPNSIVKQAPSKKIQRDSYNAKKFIVKFFKDNNLALSEKEKNITKKSFYFSKLLLLKIKEKNYLNTCYLFGFLPVLKFTDFDSHYIFKLGKIRLSLRHKSNFNYVEATSCGVTTTKRKPQLIVSLTSYSKRINFVHQTINTLLRQTLKPDRIILWLPDDENLILSEELKRLQNLGLEIRYCPNYLSYKKIVPALKEFPEDIIVTADDDLYYAQDWLESLYNAYLENPNNIYVKRAVRMQIKDNKIMPMYSRDEAVSKNFKEASFSNQLMGGSGCLFPPHSLHNDIFNTNKFLKLIPTHDDIYLWVMAILNRTKIAVVDGYDIEMLAFDGTIESGLCKINNDKGLGMKPDDAFKIILKEYPQIKEILAGCSDNSLSV